jgi:hypothetical protein
LERNLITLFSTVNTLHEKKFSGAPYCHVAREANRDMLATRLLIDREAAAAHARNKTSFFQRFYLQATMRAKHPRYQPADRMTRIRHSFRRVNASYFTLCLTAEFSRRTGRIARNCANFSDRFASSNTRDARTDALSTASSAGHRAIFTAMFSCHRRCSKRSDRQHAGCPHSAS